MKEDACQISSERANRFNLTSTSPGLCYVERWRNPALRFIDGVSPVLRFAGALPAPCVSPICDNSAAQPRLPFPPFSPSPRPSSLTPFIPSRRDAARPSPRAPEVREGGAYPRSDVYIKETNPPNRLAKFPKTHVTHHTFACRPICETTTGHARTRARGPNDNKSASIGGKTTREREREGEIEILEPGSRTRQPDHREFGVIRLRARKLSTDGKHHICLEIGQWRTNGQLAIRERESNEISRVSIREKGSVSRCGTSFFP